MNFYRCQLTLIVVCSLSLCVPHTATAGDGFWIRKGTATGPPREKIRRTVIKSAPKQTNADQLPAADVATAGPDAATDVENPNRFPANPPGSATRSTTAVAEPSVTATESKPAANPAANPDGSSTTSARSATTANQSTATTTGTGSSHVGVTFSDPVDQKWRVGVVLVTGRDAVADVYTYIPIPKAWPEQSVRVFDEDIPVEFAVQKIDELDGLDRLILRGRLIPAKRKIVALQTFTVTTFGVNAPPDTTIFTVPDSGEKLVKQFTASSSEISFRNNALRKQAQSLVETGGTAWQQVERIYDWVRDNIEQGGQDPYGTLNTFAKKTGHPEDVVGLFIAMCRANKIPARMVFVDGSQYAEFMLADPDGGLHWFPADVVGIRAFGKIVEPKVILQKGDNIRVPGIKSKKKFVAAYGEVKSKTAPNLMQFVREPLNE